MYVTNKNKMPRNHFRPFSLKDAFTSDISSSIVELPSTSSSSGIAIPVTTTKSMEDVVVVMTAESESSSSVSTGGECGSCGCRRCMRGGSRHIVVSNEDLDKKLNWILTLVIFIFIILIVHIRSQTTNKL